MWLLSLILLPIVFGLLQYVFPFKFRIWVAFILQFGINILLISIGIHFEPLRLQLSMSALPYGMVLNLDALSYTLILLNNIVFMLMTVFNRENRYMDALFLFLFLSLQGLINGIFLSFDLFNTYLLIEVSTVTVSILIMYKRDSRSMYDGMIYLLANMFAMVFFLMGIGYLYKYFGVLDFENLKAAISGVKSSSLLYLPYAFIITGVSLKAAIMPLFSWLPKAHGTPSAPSVVSAVLSGIYVKTGVYLIIRMNAIFSVLDLSFLFVVLGMITAILGFTFAIAQKDIKLILAYSTISQVGLIMFGLSGSNPAQQAGGLYHLFNHGIIKVLLFLIAGILIDTFKTRNISEMHNLWHYSKFMSIVLIIALFGITGAPFFSGSYSKYYISYGIQNQAMQYIVQLSNLGTILTFIKFFKVIWQKDQNIQKHIQVKLTRGNVITLIFLSSMVFIFGFFGSITMPWLTHYKGTLSFLDQVAKLPNYLILIIMGFGFYKLGFNNSTLFKTFEAVDLGFNAIAGTVVAFFMGMLMLLNFVA